MTNIFSVSCNRWFWIDNRDLNSRLTFRILMIFDSLAETGSLPPMTIWRSQRNESLLPPIA